MKGISKKIVGKLNRPRLCVHVSLTNIYAQLIDDINNKTLVSASTLDKEFVKGSKLKKGKNIACAKAVGILIGERALKEKIESVVFDRCGRKYHGKIKALADGARQAGLKF